MPRSSLKTSITLLSTVTQCFGSGSSTQRALGHAFRAARYLPHAGDTKVNKADKVPALRQLNRHLKSHIIKQFQLRAKVSATARVTQWAGWGARQL